MTNHTLPAPPTVTPEPVVPQVWCVDIVPDDDYDSYPELDQVFATKDAADAYAAQVIAPREARVYPMPLLSETPRLVTNYRLMVSLYPRRRESGLFANHHIGPHYDPANQTPDITQFTDAEMTGRDTLDPAVVTVHPETSHGLVLVEVVGTDKDAVHAAFVKTYLDAERGTGATA